ncbi:MAG TPA: prepilin-type N-terminal cleavage/methylation domain-containing protein [Candidatus Limnocylindrales bacterium]|nr:prepilin-type N-terminal cleavage/methylation domain-containing protein [Candidatus Limnocylindrales bacterium]
MFRSKSESGFTLIELVIVIVILGILAAVAIPKYEDMREQARVATVKGQLGSIRSAVAIQYARNALNGSATFPTLDGTIFGDGRVPKEPINNSSAVKTTPGVDDTGGWQYTAATGIVKINVSAYSSY